ncbi:MAG: ABC transporter permease [Alphaproteobacteria bacterium]|nr:ABC transporter permease [Alphaproteobacteria bacterium]
MIDFKGYGWVFVEGLMVTIPVALCAGVVAVALGLFGAWGKLASSTLPRGIANAYTTVVRGVPELVLILLVYYGVTTLLQDLLSTLTGADTRIDIDPFSAGVITLGTIYGAFATEVFRGAYLAVPKGQIEAAKAVGMPRTLFVRRVLLPQMWRFALPGLGNVWLVLVKATALMSVVQLPELMRMTDVAARAVRMPFTFYLGASVIYLAITIASMIAFQRAEAWANRGVRRA